MYTFSHQVIYFNLNNTSITLVLIPNYFTPYPYPVNGFHIYHIPLLIVLLTHFYPISLYRSYILLFLSP